jgi:hypothetical protein
MARAALELDHPICSGGSQFVPDERHARFTVADRRFLFGYGQSEVVLDEWSHFLSDLLRLCTRTNDADPKIVGISTGEEALVSVVKRISAWSLLAQLIASSYFLLDALKLVLCFLLSLEAIPFSSQ